LSRIRKKKYTPRKKVFDMLRHRSCRRWALQQVPNSTDEIIAFRMSLVTRKKGNDIEKFLRWFERLEDETSRTNPEHLLILACAVREPIVILRKTTIREIFKSPAWPNLCTLLAKLHATIDRTTAARGHKLEYHGHNYWEAAYKEKYEKILKELYPQYGCFTGALDLHDLSVDIVEKLSLRTQVDLNTAEERVDHTYNKLKELRVHMRPPELVDQAVAVRLETIEIGKSYAAGDTIINDAFNAMCLWYFRSMTFESFLSGIPSINPLP